MLGTRRNLFSLLRNGHNQMRCFASFPKESLDTDPVSNVSHDAGPPSKAGNNFKGFDLLSGHDEPQPRLNVVGFGDTTFQVNDVLIRQSVLLLPKQYFLWNAKTFEDITIDSMELFPLIKPRLEILFVGTGRQMRPLPIPLMEYFKSQGIVVDISDTINAAATFNVMSLEGRQVGAALLTLEPWKTRNNPREGGAFLG